MKEREEKRGERYEKRRLPELLGETTPGLTLSDDRGAERLSKPGIKTHLHTLTHVFTPIGERRGWRSVCGYLRLLAPAAGARQSL